MRSAPGTRPSANALVRALLVVVAAASSLPAFAELPPRASSCLAYDARYEEAPLMRVRAGISRGRVHFLGEPRACPETGSCSWRRRAYLVPGDVVFAGPDVRGYRCAYFGTANGDIVSGFLPLEALEAASGGAALDPEFLSGVWTHLRFNPITMEPGAAGAVHAVGEGEWTGRTPTAVHTGSFDATAHPVGDLIVLRDGAATGPGEADLAGAENDDGCVVWMRRRGPYLVVHDNMRCGGLNVRFQGIYVRRVSSSGSGSRDPR